MFYALRPMHSLFWMDFFDVGSRLGRGQRWGRPSRAIRALSIVYGQNIFCAFTHNIESTRRHHPRVAFETT